MVVNAASILIGSYDYRLVTLSIAIAICAAYVALEILSQLSSSSRKHRHAWLWGGAFVLGSGIWAMHYVGMEAYRLSVPVLYDWPTVALSIAIAIVASGIVLSALGDQRKSTTVWFPALVLGLGIVGMHYTGMEAMRFQGMHMYSLRLVLLSVVLAVGLSYAAIRYMVVTRDTYRCSVSARLLCALLVGLAISSMHYVGMAAVSFHAGPTRHGSLAHSIDVSTLTLAGISITIVAMLAAVLVVSASSRQQAQYAAELIRHRAHIQTIFDNLRDAVIVMDRKFNILYSNKAVRDLLEITEGVITSDQIDELYDVYLPTGEKVPREGYPSSLAMRGHFLGTCELKLLNKQTGKVLFTDVSTAPIRNNDWKMTEIILTYRDITQPKETQDTLVRLAAIVESSEDAIIGKDMQGKILTWNAGAEKIFGYTAKEMIGQPITRLLPDDRQYEEDAILQRLRRGEIVDHIETIRKKKNGQFLHMSLMISPIRDASGTVIGASKIARNITERKNLERQLYESQKLEAIGQLSGGIAHDFNNLLGVVIGNLDLLERHITEDPVAIKRIQTARSASLRGADLTRRLLSFSKNQELSPQTTDLNVVIQNVLELAAHGIGPEIKITTQLDESMPLLFVDTPGLENAILNVIVNARDAMPGGGTLTITTETRLIEPIADKKFIDGPQRGTYACISISDTGSGMAPETVEKAFEPFFTTKIDGKGTGLGLAVVYGFFKQSGGTARIYSELGYGTTVSFYLPLTAIPQQSAEVIAEPELPPITGGIVLVVDDEGELLEIAHATLSEIGYTVLTASSAAQALTLFSERQDIDILLTDIVMPGGMNGVELARSALELQPKLRVMYCSGFPADALPQRISPLAKEPLLRKPYQRHELLAAMHRLEEASSPSSIVARALRTQ